MTNPVMVNAVNKARPGSTILVLLGSYLPGYKAGGPIRSIENLVAALGGEFRFRIVTMDRDLGDKMPFPGIAAHQWVRVGKADVVYLRPGLRGFLYLYSLLRSTDQYTGIYINSFFATWFSILPVLMRWLKLCQPRRWVLAPRGEFSPGALRLKPTRKRLYMRLCKWLGIYRDFVWQASSAFESADIRREFPLAEEVAIAAVIPGLDAGAGYASHATPGSDDATASASKTRRPKKPGQLHAVFVSRVSRMKNLAGAIRMLDGLSGSISLDIYGPAEDREYFEECQAAIAALPANITVVYHGQIEHEKVRPILADHELLLLPTMGENYGHVICEALVSGCPVLISDQTPWRNLEAEGVGWDIPLSDTQRFRSILQRCADGDSDWHARISTQAMKYGAKHASDPKTVEANRRLFQVSLA